MRSEKPAERKRLLVEQLAAYRLNYLAERRRLGLVAAATKGLLLRKSLPLAAGITVAVLGWTMASMMRKGRRPAYRAKGSGAVAKIETGLDTVAKLVLLIRVVRTGISVYNALAPKGTLATIGKVRFLQSFSGMRARSSTPDGNGT